MSTCHLLSHINDILYYYQLFEGGKKPNRNEEEQDINWTVAYQKLDERWSQAGQELDKSWTRLCQGGHKLDRSWIGAGQELDRI
jgi:hypothetical protein